MAWVTWQYFYVSKTYIVHCRQQQMAHSIFKMHEMAQWHAVHRPSRHVAEVWLVKTSVLSRKIECPHFLQQLYQNSDDLLFPSQRKITLCGNSDRKGNYSVKLIQLRIGSIFLAQVHVTHTPSLYSYSRAQQLGLGQTFELNTGIKSFSQHKTPQFTAVLWKALTSQ